MRIEAFGCSRSLRPGPVAPVGQRSRRAVVASGALMACLAFSGQVSGQAPPPESPAATEALPADVPASNEKICRYEDVTGSRMRKRVCHTAERWEARERQSKAMVRELDDKPVRGYTHEL